MIRGYPRHASIRPGERLQLHVSTDRPRFRAALYRWGDGVEPVMRSDWLPGKHAVDAGPADDWQDLSSHERQAAREGIHAATLGIYQRGGAVFSAGTTDWAQVIDGPRDRRVERITRNVLDRLLA